MPAISRSALVSLGLVAGTLTLAVAANAAGLLVDGGACGSLDNPFGPFDYRRISGTDLQLIETHHFTAAVESLEHGHEGPIGGDLSYTLRAIPNHPRALLAMSRLALREHGAQPYGAGYSVECWFDRAIAFAPDDPMVRVLYANYLVAAGKPDRALMQLGFVHGAGPDDANLQYNLGLAYFRLKEYARAVEHARRAYALGFPLPGLRELLVSVGKWKESRSAAPTNHVDK